MSLTCSHRAFSKQRPSPCSSFDVLIGVAKALTTYPKMFVKGWDFTGYEVAVFEADAWARKDSIADLPTGTRFIPK